MRLMLLAIHLSSDTTLESFATVTERVIFKRVLAARLEPIALLNLVSLSIISTEVLETY